jgi:ribulose-bisphosphate carboxylase large chain
MWAGQVPDSLQRFRTHDLMYIAGGGIQGHPLGAAAGVASIRQALEAATQGITLAEYGRTHPELQAALEAFGARQEPK